MFLLKGIQYSVGGRVLLDGVDWQVTQQDRVALIGGNGVGKSTLMRIIAGLQEPDAGEVQSPRGATFGFLPQDGLTFQGNSLFEEARSVFAQVMSAEQELRALEEQLGSMKEGDDEYTDILARYDALLEQFQRWDGYRIDAEVGKVLEGLGFSRVDWEKPCQQFSGGWQMRIALARLLLARPSMLLLDEPTNHLDLEARQWLQSYLAEYPSAVLLVSHDRYFLDVVVKRCTELFMGQLTDYHGNFTYYEIERERRYEALEEAARRQEEEIEKIERFVERFRYKNTKASQVQSRIKQLEKIERISLPPKPPKVKFSFPEPPRSGRIVMELNNISKSYGSNHVLRGLSLQLERQERIALLGVNGAGKSTLLRIMAGEDQFEGERILGYQVSLGFFAQDQRSVLEPEHTLLQSMEAISPIDMVPRLRSLLGAFLFRGDDVYKKVSVLSGGERSRLALARMLLQPYNVLLLDEPTNHLDIQAQEILLNALQDFPGTILFVSHDRHFIDKLATGVIEVHDGIAERFLGNYEEYLRTKLQRGELVGANDGVRYTTATHANEHGTVLPTASSGAGTKSNNADARFSEDNQSREAKQKLYQEQQQVRREQARQEKQLRKQIEELEQGIATREEEMQRLESDMAVEGFYDNFQKANETVERYHAIKGQIEAHYARWEELSLELDGLSELQEQDKS